MGGGGKGKGGGGFARLPGSPGGQAALGSPRGQAASESPRGGAASASPGRQATSGNLRGPAALGIPNQSRQAQPAMVRPLDNQTADGDGEVSISFELPQCKVDELLKQLQEQQTVLKDTFPLAYTAKVEAVAPPSGKREDFILPQPTPAFDPVSKLARLREIQERYAVITEQRERAEQARILMDTMPVAGEPTPMPPRAPSDSVGATFGVDAPAIVPPPFPPPGGLPFPYSGLPGVMAPKAQAPPEPHLNYVDEDGTVSSQKKPDIASADFWVEDERALDEDGISARALPKPDYVFLKDGMDMSLYQLRSHGERMAQDVKEMCRKLDEAKETAELRQLHTNPEVMDQFLKQQRIINEQQRKIDEGQMEIKLEEERQFWVTRDQRQRAQRKAYGDQYVGVPEENTANGYSTVPPELRTIPHTLDSEFDVSSAREALGNKQYPAFQYAMVDPDAPKDIAPLSSYEEDIMPSQAYHRNLLQEAARKNWPAAPTFDPRAQQVEDEEPEGEAPVRGQQGGRRRRPPRRGQQGVAGVGFDVGARDATSPLPNEPLRGAPASEQLFMSGWRDADANGQPLPFSAFAGDRERPLGHPHFAAFAGEDEDHERRPRRLRVHTRAGSAPLDAPAGASAGLPETPRAAAVQPEPWAETEGVRAAGIDSDSEAASDEGGGWLDVFSGFGLSGVNPLAAEPTPFEAEQTRYGSVADPSALYLAGACQDRAPPLVPPDLEVIESQGYAAVVSSCAEVLSIRRAGKLGDRLSAQVVLNYLVAVAKNADPIVRQGDGSKHVSTLVDVLSFYPLAVDIHLWALEGLVVLFRSEDHDSQESLSGPIFDAVSNLMDSHTNDPSLYEKAKEMPKRILSALALVLTPATTPRLKTKHVDFTLGVIRSTGVGPSLMEHGLQLLLVARIAHRIREQAMVARAALRSFRAEPRLVTRSFLAIGTAFEIAVEAAQPDDEPVEGDEARPTDEEAALDGAPLARLNPRVAEQDGVKKHIWKHRLLDQAGLAHKALVETAPPLAGAYAAQGPAPSGDKHLIPVGLRDIITGMDLYAQDRKVQGAAAVALAAAVMLPGVSTRAMKAEGVIRAMVLAQQHFSNSRSIALHLCQVLVQFARTDNTILSIDLAVTALDAGTAFVRDAEVAVAALQVIHAFALRLHELCPDRSNRLTQMASDLVRLGEGRHGNPHALGMLLVIFVAAASDGRGTGAGGVAGEQWRQALANAAAVVVPLRVLYEHVDNIDLVLTAAIALRVLTYGNKVSAAHVSRLRGIEALLGTIQKHHHRADMARELLAALGNIGVDQAACDLFAAKLPDGAEALYLAMEKSGPEDPDVLAQGCRALGALTAGPNQGRTRFAIDLNRIDKAVAKTSTGISTRLGTTEDDKGGYLELFTGTAEATQKRRKKLRDICVQLIECMVASGPQFCRLVGKDGELLAELQPRRHAARARGRTPPAQK